MKRLLALAVLFSLIVLLTPLFAADAAKDKAKAREALAALNEFVGSYKGAGAPDKPKSDPKDQWNEKLSWGWKFKGEDRWLHIDIEKGKYFKSGDLRYNVDKKKYELAMVTADDKKILFEGDLKDEILSLDSTNPETKETVRLKMNMAGEGARFIYRLERKKGTLFAKDYLVACSKEGESFAGGGKKNLCCVTGGLGTMAVTFQGKTYYVCCTGCRDAFMENPEKIIKEFEASKKK